MSKAPPIPREQSSFAEKPLQFSNDGQSRHDRKSGLQSAENGDADVNLDQQGRQGNLHQNVETVQARVQDR
jgi:hypothetical protein